MKDQLISKFCRIIESNGPEYPLTYKVPGSDEFITVVTYVKTQRFMGDENGHGNIAGLYEEICNHILSLLRRKAGSILSLEVFNAVTGDGSALRINEVLVCTENFIKVSGLKIPNHVIVPDIMMPGNEALIVHIDANFSPITLIEYTVMENIIQDPTTFNDIRAWMARYALFGNEETMKFCTKIIIPNQ